jgi:signal transduction histidine kinase
MYVRIYAALLACLVVAALLFGAIHVFYNPYDNGGLEAVGQLAAEALPAAGAPPREQVQAMRAFRREHGRVDLAVYDAGRALVGAVGRPMPALNPAQVASGPMIGSPAVLALQLNDGRWLLVRRTQPNHIRLAVIVMLLLAAGVVAIGAYPVVRRITRRLERLQASVQAWGAGNLSSRVAVEGEDEVARLATSFNEAAARIEGLVGAQKTLLANASHELRSPLTRIRMGVELLEGSAPDVLRAELARSIGELDQLIDEVLLASRLDAMPVEEFEPVDLAALAAEEAARAGAQVQAEPAQVCGSARLLRRLVRNLLENGRRYGNGAALEVELRHTGGNVQLDVCDRGPGVPASERARIFEPFYRLPGASERDGGVGLGLSLVRQIAVRHGGHAECLPREGGGSCFRVVIPAQAGIPAR